MDDFKIEHITDDELINLWPLIQQIPLADMLHSELLARCLLRQYTVKKGTLDEQTIGFGIYYISARVCTMVALYAPKHVQRLASAFFTYFRGMGIERMRAYTVHDDKIMRNVLEAGFKKAYVMMEKEL